MSKSTWLSGLRWLVTAALVVVLVSRVDLASLRAAFAQISMPVLVVLIILAAVLQVPLARRLLVLVRAAASVEPGPRKLTMRSVLGDQLSGVAANSVLPSTVGGDVVRVMLVRGYLGGEAPAARATGLILIDRVIGLLALCTPPLVLGGLWSASWSSLALLAAGAVLLGVMWQLPRVLGWGVRLVPQRWQRLHEFVSGLARGVQQLPMPVRWRAFGWSLLYQCCVGCFFELACSGWGIDARYHEAIWVGIPAAMVLSALPVSIGGFGWRESLFAGVFVACGLPAANGVTLGLWWALSGLPTALAGAVVYAKRGVDDGRAT